MPRAGCRSTPSGRGCGAVRGDLLHLGAAADAADASPRTCAHAASRRRRFTLTPGNSAPRRPRVLAGPAGLRHRRHRPARRLARAAAARGRRRRRVPGARLGAALGARRARPDRQVRVVRGDVRDQDDCSSGRSASTRSRRSSTWPRRRPSASPTAIRSRRSTRTSAARGRCSRRAGAARRCKQIVVASSDKAYGDQDDAAVHRGRAGARPASVRRQQVVRRPDGADVREELRPAGLRHALRQLLRRRRSELEPHRARARSARCSAASGR